MVQNLIIINNQEFLIWSILNCLWLVLCNINSTNTLNNNYQKLMPTSSTQVLLHSARPFSYYIIIAL